MFGNARTLARRLLAGEDGLETVEYAIIMGLIVGGTLAVLAAIGAWVLQTYSDAQGQLGAS